MSEHVTGRSTQTKERMLSMTGWLDISTVPNDVYEILAVNEFGTIKVCYRKLFGHVSGRWEYFRNDEMVPGHTWSMVPTHWMPLPKPPAKNSGFLGALPLAGMLK